MTRTATTGSAQSRTYAAHVPFFHAHVRYKGELHSWETAGRALIVLTQDNALLDAQREILSVEFPRRKFETELQITVGGLRADQGTYYRGPQRAEGITRLAALQESHKLGLVEGAHLISRVFDPVDHSRDESTYVSAHVSFSRPHWKTAASSISTSTTGAFGERNNAALMDAAWQTFIRLVEAAPIDGAHGGWGDRTGDWGKPPPGEPPVAPFMVLTPHLVERLGGVSSTARALGAFDVHPMCSDPTYDVAIRLGSQPEDMTDDRVAQLRSILCD